MRGGGLCVARWLSRSARPCSEGGPDTTVHVRAIHRSLESCAGVELAGPAGAVWGRELRRGWVGGPGGCGLGPGVAPGLGWRARRVRFGAASCAGAGLAGPAGAVGAGRGAGLAGSGLAGSLGGVGVRRRGCCGESGWVRWRGGGARSGGAGRGPRPRAGGPGPSTTAPGTTSRIESGATGEAGAPHADRHAPSWAELTAYTMRPRPTQPCAAEHIGQCSPDV